MTTLAIHFRNGEHTIVDNVTAYFLYGEYWHVRTFFGNCPEERQYDRNKIIAIFEVEDDGRKEVI